MPLLASVSSAARGMKLIVILAILSWESDKNIYQANFLFSDTELREVLCNLAAVDSEKVCRCMWPSFDRYTLASVYSVQDANCCR